MDFTYDKYSAPNAIENIKILGALANLANLAQFEVDGLNWQSCLASSSKRALRILIFSIAMGAKYLSYVKSIATFAPTFYGYIISDLASV